jgi:dTDP-N-acetylfucosamine:lipid II N-acetylfucosaminyltransferase
MNLHIVPDSKFTDRFYSNLEEAGITSGNKFVVRTNERELKYISHDIPFAKSYSAKFSTLVGDTSTYENVFIHQFSPLLYRWVALNSFKKLHWCVWGADIYNLPGVAKDFYEPMTWDGFSRNSWKNELLYTIKLYATSMYFKKRAYEKVSHILTWMRSEFDFVKATLELNSAEWRFFFYENHLPYEHLDSIRRQESRHSNGRLKFIVGNSGTDTNNHLDAVKRLSDLGMKADLVIPVSYGSAEYVTFLKKSLEFYKNGRIEFIETFLAFNDYVKLLLESDGLIMNHLRPQGYGNILMMMYLDKPVFLNPGNFSIRDLDSNKLRWMPLEKITTIRKGAVVENRETVKDLLSHQKLLQLYREIFGASG